MIDEIFFVDTAYTLFWAQVDMHGSTVALSYRWWTVSEGDEKGDFFLSGRAAGAVRRLSPESRPVRSARSAPPVPSGLGARASPPPAGYTLRLYCRALRARLGRASGGASGAEGLGLARRVPRSVSFARFRGRAPLVPRQRVPLGSRPLSVRPAGRARRGLGSPSPRLRRDGFYFESNFRFI